jgi:tetratricopeptide (TPR) repeat protein
MKLTIQQALQQATASHKEGKLQEAERLYRTILQAHPTHPDANHKLGLIVLSLNNSGAALPLFKAALDRNPSIEQFWISYVDALIKEKQFKNAKRALKKANKAGFIGAKLEDLQAQLISKIQAQVRGYQPPLQAPLKAEIDSMLASYQNGERERARNLALANTKKYPEHSLSWKVLGAVLGQAGQVGEALIANQKAAILDPRDAIAHSNLGITLKDLGRFEDAEASYRQAIALKPEFAQAYSNLGYTLQERGRFEEAEVSCKQSIQLNPDDARAHINLSVTLLQLGRLAEAEVSCRRAIQIKPDEAR